jgi:hypothetical protein
MGSNGLKWGKIGGEFNQFCQGKSTVKSHFLCTIFLREKAISSRQNIKIKRLKNGLVEPFNEF